jgi:hypothetical protein
LPIAPYRHAGTDGGSLPDISGETLTPPVGSSPEMASCLSLVFPCRKGDEDGVSHQVAKTDLAVVDALEVLDFHLKSPE